MTVTMTAETKNAIVPSHDFFFSPKKRVLPYFLPISAAKTSDIIKTDKATVATSFGKKKIVKMAEIKTQEAPLSKIFFALISCLRSIPPNAFKYKFLKNGMRLLAISILTKIIIIGTSIISTTSFDRNI